MDFFSGLLESAGANPLIQFLVGIVGFGIFIQIVMSGLKFAVFGKMAPGPKRKRMKRIVAHALPPLVALVLFGNKMMPMGMDEDGTPVRGWWGYLGAALMGWLGSIAAIAIHHHRKKKAKAKSRLP